jgi:hypothetical protein
MSEFCIDSSNVFRLLPTWYQSPPQSSVRRLSLNLDSLTLKFAREAPSTRLFPSTGVGMPIANIPFAPWGIGDRREASLISGHRWSRAHLITGVSMDKPKAAQDNRDSWRKKARQSGVLDTEPRSASVMGKSRLCDMCQNVAADPRRQPHHVVHPVTGELLVYNARGEAVCPVCSALWRHVGNIIRLAEESR